MPARHPPGTEVNKQELLALQAALMDEDTLQGLAIDEALERGWLVHHCRPGLNRRGKWATPIQGSPGFPDLIATRKSRLIVVEIKSQKGVVQPEQRLWLEEFVLLAGRSHGLVQVYVWRPSDWLSGEIARVLH